MKQTSVVCKPLSPKAGCKITISPDRVEIKAPKEINAKQFIFLKLLAEKISATVKVDKSFRGRFKYEDRECTLFNNSGKECIYLNLNELTLDALKND